MKENKIGRPVEIVSLSFSDRPLDEICSLISKEADKGCDLIVLPETWRGDIIESLDGETITAMTNLADKYNTYIICPMYRKTQGIKRINSAVLIDRKGDVVCIYDKIYPYWSEFDLDPITVVGDEARVYETDFGKIGMAICFDANFPEVWKRLSQKGAEIVFFSSAYSAGTSLKAHSINHNYNIVSSTLCSDCVVYDIAGREIHYSKNSGGINISRVNIDLDKRIFHQNFNISKRDEVLKDYAGKIEQDMFLDREQWFTLRSLVPGISVQQICSQYGMEELTHYKERSTIQIDHMRGYRFAGKTL